MRALVVLGLEATLRRLLLLESLAVGRLRKRQYQGTLQITEEPAEALAVLNW